MKITYDKEADALYIRFREGKFDHNDEPAEGIILDIDPRGEVLGIEILDVSRRTSLRELFDINISMPVGAR